MADPKPRSSFLLIMLIIVGLLVCSGLVLVFVPIVECRDCGGSGSMGVDLMESPPVSEGCGRCANSGRLPVLDLFPNFPGVAR